MDESILQQSCWWGCIRAAVPGRDRRPHLGAAFVCFCRGRVYRRRAVRMLSSTSSSSSSVRVRAMATPYAVWMISSSLSAARFPSAFRLSFVFMHRYIQRKHTKKTHQVFFFQVALCSFFILLWLPWRRAPGDNRRYIHTCVAFRGRDRQKILVTDRKNPSNRPKTPSNRQENPSTRGSIFCRGCSRVGSNLAGRVGPGRVRVTNRTRSVIILKTS